MQFGTNFVCGQSGGEMSFIFPHKRPFGDSVTLSGAISQAWFCPTDPFTLDDLCVPKPSCVFLGVSPLPAGSKADLSHADTRPHVSLCFSIILWVGSLGRRWVQMLDPDSAAGKV